MRFVGIDVGHNGAIAFVDGDGGYRIYDMPVFSVRRGKRVFVKINEAQLIEMIDALTHFVSNGEGEAPLNNCIFYFEKQKPFPKQGVVSVFELGKQYGFIRGVLRTRGFRFEEVEPQKWQREFSIVKSKNTKFASYEAASSLFPRARLKTERGRILDGRCDAILIAEYGRRTYRGRGG